MDTGGDLGDDCFGLGKVLGALRASSSVTIFNMSQDQRLKTICRVGTDRIKRRSITRVAKIIRELNNLGHAAEVLPKNDLLPESNLRIGVKATLR